MTYNEHLADRLRIHLVAQGDVAEKNMMGSLTFMVNGKMCVGIVKDELMVRLHPDLHDEVIEKNGCREMDFTGNTTKGYVFVASEAIESEKDLKYWMDLALEFNPLAKTFKKKKK